MEGMKRAAALALLSLAPPLAQAGDDARWYVQVDNDVVFHTDRWYTSGVRIARVEPDSEGRYWEIGLLQEVYTPDTKSLAPIDRPYAGRLLLAGARHAFMGNVYRTLEVDAGVRGPDAMGRQATQFVHRIVPAPDFDWSRQLPNELDVQAIAVQTHEFSPVAVHYGAVLGNQVTFAHAGAEVRIGASNAIAGPALRFAATPPLVPANPQGWGGYAGVSARWVARNELLSVNVHALGPPIEREKGVVRIAAGLSWTGSWGAVTFSLVQDTKEFATQHSPHRFGILGVRLDFL
jgi:lipid A 3-O-deacylase